MVVEVGQVKVDYRVVQELFVGQRLVVMRRHGVTLKLAQSSKKSLKQLQGETEKETFKYF